MGLVGASTIAKPGAMHTGIGATVVLPTMRGASLPCRWSAKDEDAVLLIMGEGPGTATAVPEEK